MLVCERTGVFMRRIPRSSARSAPCLSLLSLFFIFTAMLVYYVLHLLPLFSLFTFYHLHIFPYFSSLKRFPTDLLLTSFSFSALFTSLYILKCIYFHCLIFICLSLASLTSLLLSASCFGLCDLDCLHASSHRGQQFY